MKDIGHNKIGKSEDVTKSEDMMKSEDMTKSEECTIFHCIDLVVQDNLNENRKCNHDFLI
jgi:hypothetical protein